MYKFNSLTKIFSLSLAIAITFFATPIAQAEEDINRHAIPVPDDASASYSDTAAENTNSNNENSENSDTTNSSLNNPSYKGEQSDYGIELLEDNIAEDDNQTDSDSNNESSEDANSEEELEEAATWPMLVSLIALGTTIIAVLLINLAGRKHK